MADIDGPGGSHGRADIYTPEFRADTVALWWASAGQRTTKDVAADLGITRETLRLWVRAAEGGQAPVGGSGQSGSQEELSRLRSAADAATGPAPEGTGPRTVPRPQARCTQVSTTSPKRSTISSMSASVTMNGGAKRTWFPSSPSTVP
jgi:transposase-like protein